MIAQQSPARSRQWPIERLGELVEFTRRPPRLRVNESVPFLPMALVPQGGGEITSFDRRSGDNTKGTTYFEEGDFLLATITPCFQNGKQAVVRNVPGGWGMATTEVLAMRSPAALPEYLAYVFRSAPIHQALLGRMVGGTGRMRLPRAALQDLLLPIPALEVQQEIVSRLDALLAEVDASMGALAGAIAKVPTLRQSLLVAGFTGRLTTPRSPGTRLTTRRRPIAPHDPKTGEALLAEVLRTREAEAAAVGASPKAPLPPNDPPADFALPTGWAWAGIDQLVLKVQYGTSAKTGGDSSGVPVLRMGNLQHGSLDWEQLKYLPADHDDFPALLLNERDVLFNRTNSPELVGKTALVQNLPGPASFASYLIRIVVHPQVEAAWVSYWLNSPFGRRWARAQASQQVGQANINGKKLRSMAIPLPATDEQQQICARLDAYLDRIAAAADEWKAAASTAASLRQSILREGLEGRLTTPRETDS